MVMMMALVLVVIQALFPVNSGSTTAAGAFVAVGRLMVVIVVVIVAMPVMVIVMVIVAMPVMVIVMVIVVVIVPLRVGSPRILPIAGKQFEEGHHAEQQPADERLQPESTVTGQVVDDSRAGEKVDHHAAPEQKQRAGHQPGPRESRVRRSQNRTAFAAAVITVIAAATITVTVVMPVATAARIVAAVLIVDAMVVGRGLPAPGSGHRISFGFHRSRVV